MMRIFVLIAVALTQAVLVSGCADNSEFCADWKSSGWCSDYKEQLQDLCAKTCGFCSGGGGGGGGGDGGDPGVAVDPRPARELQRPDLCRDTCSSKDCAWYKSNGHCEQYSAVMMANCAQTCGWCNANTCSPPEVENGWSDFENTLVPSGANVNIYCYEGFTSYASSVPCNGYDMDEVRCTRAEEGDGAAADKTACQRAAASALEPVYAGGNYAVPQPSTHYVPQCDDYNGNYKQIQYDGGKGETFCVDVYRGSEVQGTRISGNHDYIGCTANSAKEYYDRLAAEKGIAPESSNGGDSYSYDQGGYDQGGYDQGGYDQGYDQGGYDQGGYEANGDQGYDQGYDQGGYDQGGYDQGYDQGGYEANGDQGYDQGYDQGGYDQGYDQGGYDQGGYADNGYDQGYPEDNYDQGYDQGGYDQGGYDSGYDAGYDDQGYDAPDFDDSYYDTASGGFDQGGYYNENNGEADYYDARYYADGDEEAEAEGGEVAAAEVFYSATEKEGSMGDFDFAADKEASGAAAVEDNAEDVVTAEEIKEMRRRRRMRTKRSLGSLTKEE